MKHRLNALCALLIVLSILLGGCAAGNGSSSGAKGSSAAGSGAEQTTGTDNGDAGDPTDPDVDATEPNTDPTDPDEDPTDPDEGPEDPNQGQGYGGETDSFFSAFPGNVPASVEVLLYNEPWLIGGLEPTEIWNEGDYDRLYIIPRSAGTKIRAFRVSEDENGELTVAETPTYSTTAKEGCVIYAALDRPEGFPAWYLEAELSDGQTVGMMLEYDGRYGTAQFEYLERDFNGRILGEATDPAVLEAMAGICGEKKVRDFWRGAGLAGMANWAEASACFSAITEIGDGASFTLTQSGEYYDGAYRFKIARFHSAYYEDSDTLAGSVAAQYAKYQQIGNSLGILGPGRDGTGVELTYQLTGVSVFNTVMAAEKVEILVNGESAGTFTLPRDRFCTLIPLDLPEVTADKPIEVEVKVVDVYFGDAEGAIIEAEAGIGGNISGAL